ncbi:hypothetical protein QE152_g7921 [Popillia japonica]|uniref:Uncharacterized protein n=1 Tax=Popillia japonica TaxID=7064 RepID=A0AAW1M720_POPJA
MHYNTDFFNRKTKHQCITILTSSTEQQFRCYTIRHQTSSKRQKKCKALEPKTGFSNNNQHSITMERRQNESKQKEANRGLKKGKIHSVPKEIAKPKRNSAGINCLHCEEFFCPYYHRLTALSTM